MSVEFSLEIFYNDLLDALYTSTPLSELDANPARTIRDYDKVCN